MLIIQTDVRHRTEEMNEIKWILCNRKWFTDCRTQWYTNVRQAVLQNFTVCGVCWVFTWIVSFVFNTKLVSFLGARQYAEFRKWLETPFGSFQSCSYTLSDVEADLVFYFHSTSKVWFVRWQVLTLHCVIFHFILLIVLVPRSAMLQLFCITLLWLLVKLCSPCCSFKFSFALLASL